MPRAVVDRLSHWGVSVTRRYSEFAWLHRQLGAEGLPSQILPRLPGKLLAVPRIDEDADTADHAALLRRQGELDLFLRALLRLPQLRTSLALKQFLASDAPPQSRAGSLHGPGGVPPGGPAASVTAVMLAMPTVENWMRFCWILATSRAMSRQSATSLGAALPRWQSGHS